ncbi:hypothetical protein IscW_ISCW000497 [Ixodes scapularis]|uniref:Uncharacterized protein n=1 Tax=Ixodes scapularis TaxID=6945 RepID=B7P708_IXOSC|nr:hypothetical protein IscW_ISCW000497 [Ixodes scapularis]|eukprot:XP_002409433.1 hypothetical protein IscW_ISCW000497 [Ixodes scapularis]
MLPKFLASLGPGLIPAAEARLRYIFFPNLKQTLPRFLNAMLSNPLLQGLCPIASWPLDPHSAVGRHLYL